MSDPGFIFWAVLIALFFGIRRFWWWYFGVDRAIAAFESIDESLRCLPAVAAVRDRVPVKKASGWW